MGEASRRKKEGREVKDPLRWRKANIERFQREVEMLAKAYHGTLARLKDETSALEVAADALRTNGHPLYQPAAPEAPEPATAPEAAASEVTSP